MGNLIHFLFFLVWNLIIKVLRVRIWGSCWFLAIAFGVVRSGEVRICLQNQDQLAILAHNTILVMYCISWFLPLFFKGQKDFRQVFLRVETTQGLQSQEYAGCITGLCVAISVAVAEEYGVGLHHSTGPRIISQAGNVVVFFFDDGHDGNQRIREVK